MRMNDFKNKLLNIINESKLSIEEVYYIWKDLFDEISITYNNTIVQEKNQQKEKEIEKENNNEEIQE